MSMAALSDLLVALAIVTYAVTFAISAAVLARSRVTARFGARSPVAAPVGSPAPGSPRSAGATEAGRATGTRNEVPGDASAPGLAARTARVLLLLAWVLNLGAVVARGVAAERAPWGNMYEFALVGAVAIVAAFLVGMRTYPIEGLRTWVTGLVLVVLGLAVTVLYAPVDALIPVLDSYWLAIHVAAAIVAGGAFTIAFLASTAYLVGQHRDRRAGREPDPAGVTAALERASYGLVVFAFPIWTFAVLAGAVWAEAAWGRYWGWDPKETWAFITWVLYAAYLHAQATAGWRGTRAAWFSVLGYAAFLFNFVGVNIWIAGLHSYAGV